MKIDVNALKDSNEFLNLLLANIDTAVFIADENLKIYQFNDSFLHLFRRSDEIMAEMTFGAASGCINAVRENKPCGETSACQYCILKQSLIDSLSIREPHEKKSLERVFYIHGQPVKKYLEFTSRPIVFQSRRMILVFIYDVTKIELKKIELKKKQRQIDLDLEKAAEVQKNLLPQSLPEIPSISIHWFFEPCRMVGGDIFHIYKEDDRHISAYILDVCGHGVSAALIAVTVKQFMDQLHAQGLSRGEPFPPEKILNRLEAEFPFERFDCYFTIVHVLLDLRTGTLLYGCAGHVPPVVAGPNHRFKILDRHGTIIGLGRDPSQEQYETTLIPGDKLILYTDGLIDYFGPKGKSGNKNEFYNLLKTISEKPCKEIVNEVVEALKKNRGQKPIDDDISLLAIEYNGYQV
ncbi:MAG: SpoIIE family protein phosphatase [Desulfobacula sp.]|nr:SpoIIE family protein phosphatase [Desulfobacula sp.]